MDLGKFDEFLVHSAKNYVHSADKYVHSAGFCGPSGDKNVENRPFGGVGPFSGKVQFCIGFSIF